MLFVLALFHVEEPVMLIMWKNLHISNIQNRYIQKNGYNNIFGQLPMGVPEF